MPACGQLPSWQGCQVDDKLQCSPGEGNLEEVQGKYQPPVQDELPSCKDHTATSWSASQLSQQSHLWGAGSDGRRPSEQQRADLLLWATSQPNNRAARKHLHGQRRIRSTRWRQFSDTPQASFSRKANIGSFLPCAAAMPLAQIARQRLFWCCKYVLTVPAGPGTSLLNFVISLYMSEVCAKHVHIPSAALLL